MPIGGFYKIKTDYVSHTGVYRGYRGYRGPEWKMRWRTDNKRQMDDEQADSAGGHWTGHLTDRSKKTGVKRRFVLVRARVEGNRVIIDN